MRLRMQDHGRQRMMTRQVMTKVAQGFAHIALEDASDDRAIGCLSIPH